MLRLWELLMSSSPEGDLDLDKLFLPAWATQTPETNRWAGYTGNEGGGGRRDDNRGDRRGPPRRDQPGQGGGPRGGGGYGGREGGGGRFPREGGRPQRPGGRDFEQRDQQDSLPPLAEVNLTIMPEERSMEFLVRQIKSTGRAYPLFEIAQMVLQKPERQVVKFEVKKKPDGTPIQPLFLCALDDSLWLTEAEAVTHVFEKHFATFYQADRIATPPPKGVYTFVAQCGLSGVILGPPNHHDYQTQLRKLHTERFSRMPFEMFKARVRIVRDEAVVKKWIDEQSWKTEYVVLNTPDSIRLPSREAVEQHFRETHVATMIRAVDSHLVVGAASRNMACRPLLRLVRREWEDQRRFPLKIASQLSQYFASHGLQMFKRDKTVTHVCVARPHYLDVQAAPVSDLVNRILAYINTTPKAKRMQLIEALAPTPAAPAPVALPDGTIPAPAPASDATPEQAELITTVHWLLHQGHIIEFADGVMETAKKPQIKPVKPAKPAAEKPATPAPAEAPATAPAAEVAPAAAPVAEVPPVAPAVEEPVVPAVEAPAAPAPDAGTSPA